MYKEGQKFLQSWCNDTKNEGYENELKEYSEREVENMLYEYRLKFSLSDVGESFYCWDNNEYNQDRCENQCKTCSSIELRNKQ
jgi:hypothetical protein